jgi:hypothetical protein
MNARLTSSSGHCLVVQLRPLWGGTCSRDRAPPAVAGSMFALANRSRARRRNWSRPRQTPWGNLAPYPSRGVEGPGPLTLRQPT